MLTSSEATNPPQGRAATHASSTKSAKQVQYILVTWYLTRNSNSKWRPAQGYELVMAVTLASFVAHNLYMPAYVMKARKKYGIEYPVMYATKDDCKSEEDAKAFNCIQRGHQNSLEAHGSFLVLLNLAGLQHPMAAAAAGAAFIAGRLLYFHGYSSGQPKARQVGAPLYLGAMVAVMAIVGKTVYVWAANKK